jgi:hypothetical protein
LKSNVIILTSGLSGSSILAGLISKKGYWLGDYTEKINYQTYENSELVRLNINLFQEGGYSWHDVTEIPPPLVDDLYRLSLKPGTDKYIEFVQKCSNNQPWLWKDPRLSYTIFFWREFLNIGKCKFILMHRDIKQSWTGIVLRGKAPISFENLRIVEENCVRSSRKFLKKEGISFLDITFEDLILDPDETINLINKYLAIDLSLNDLQSIYKGSFYKLRWSTVDFYKAKMKYYYCKFIKRDTCVFPRKREGRGSGWYHIKH